MTRRGKFITLEGPEGSGKSTHAKALLERLRAAGYPVIAARDPGGTNLGEAIRSLLQQELGDATLATEAELFLFMASRAQLVHQVILPALSKGTHVIADRFADSTCAYQGYGRGFDLDRILMINDLATQGLQPDLTLLLDIPVALGFERVRERSCSSGALPDRIECETLAFHEKVRCGYLDLARRWPERIQRIDTTAPAEEVQESIWRIARHAVEA